MSSLSRSGKMELGPLGDRAYLARFDSEDEAAAWARAVRVARRVGVIDVVLAYRTAALYADPQQIDLEELGTWLAELEIGEGEAGDSGRLIDVPVLYDGEDLENVAQRLKIQKSEVIQAHTSADYRVFAVGFLPGFPYAGYLPEKLSGLARREWPRLRVAAGSVAIAGRQTGIYPQESPGGWHLIGRTPLKIVDAARGHFPIRAGDLIRFVSIDRDEFNARRGEPL